MEKNNNDEPLEFNTNDLYNIASRLKLFKEERIECKAILQKNPSRNIRERYNKAKEEYGRALNDFSYFVNNFIKWNATVEDDKGEN